MQQFLVSVLYFALLSSSTAPFKNSARPSHVLSHTAAIVRPNTDDADAITEGARLAITSLTTILKLKAAEARKQNDLAISKIDAMKLEIQKISSLLADGHNQKLGANAEDAEEFGRLARQRRDRGLDNIRNFIEKLRSIEDGEALGGDVLSPISNDLTHAIRLVQLIKQNDRRGLSSLLKRNVPTLNVSIIDSRADNGATVKFSVGSFITCLSSKQNCDGKNHSVTDNPNFVIPASELSTRVESLDARFKSAEDLLKAILLRARESARENNDEEKRRIQEAQQAFQRVLEALATMADTLAVLHSNIKLKA